MFQVQNILQSHVHWPAVQAIYHRLHDHGYKAFLAGGCVRDALLGLIANDLDMVTDAKPDEIEALFEKTVSVGKSFGVIRVLWGEADIEVATFRTDGNYVDGRHPEGVRFSSPEEDAQRRDFTVNALFYDLGANEVLDYVSGQQDLDQRIIRTVGDADKRFQEDHLRLLRAARFVAQLDFELEQTTFEALKKMAALVKTVSGERLRDEMYKLLKAKAVAKGLEVMNISGLMQYLFPFRLKNNIWSGSYHAQFPWQYFALFFREAPAEDFKSAVEMLKLSVKEQRAIEKSWVIFKQPAEFFTLSLGKKLKTLSDEGVRWALNVFSQENKDWEQEAKQLLEQFAAWNHVLPRPFLTGDDLAGKLVGKDIGNCLSEAYEMQLEQKMTNRQQAEEWLLNYLEKRIE